MSLGPTYGATFPDATVDTISFGTPTGSARIAGVTSAVPPDPPSPISPATSSRAATNRSNATAIAATDRPRSPVNTAPSPSGWCAATARAGTSAAPPSPFVPRSTSTAGTPAASISRFT